jgi:hypothetical protein
MRNLVTLNGHFDGATPSPLTLRADALGDSRRLIAPARAGQGGRPPQQTKVFCFFFSKKKTLFFFGKKNQKTFASPEAHHCLPRIDV